MIVRDTALWRTLEQHIYHGGKQVVKVLRDGEKYYPAQEEWPENVYFYVQFHEQFNYMTPVRCSTPGRFNYVGDILHDRYYTIADLACLLVCGNHIDGLVYAPEGYHPWRSDKYAIPPIPYSTTELLVEENYPSGSDTWRTFEWDHNAVSQDNAKIYFACTCATQGTGWNIPVIASAKPFTFINEEGIEKHNDYVMSVASWVEHTFGT